MSVEDRVIARVIQRELNRHQQLDVTGAKIFVTRGIGHIEGVIKAGVGQYIRPLEETKSIMEMVRRIPGLRDLIIEVRWDV